MASFKEKFALTLKNAERILELMRHTHRQRIQQEEQFEEEERQVQADHTFQSPHQTLMDETKLKEDVQCQSVKANGKVKRWTVADKLELDFLRKTHQDYCSDLTQIESNEQNVLMAIEKIVERLNSLKDSQEVIGRLRAKNLLLDEELQAYENENRELDGMLLKERFAQMRMVEQTQKNIRNLLKAEQNEQNEVYSGFARKWNGYLSQLAQPPNSVIDLSRVERQAFDEANKLIASSTVDNQPQPKQPPNLAKKKSEMNSELLGNLKEFSKNLKLPSEKKK